MSCSQHFLYYSQLMTNQLTNQLCCLFTPIVKLYVFGGDTLRAGKAFTVWWNSWEDRGHKLFPSWINIKVFSLPHKRCAEKLVTTFSQTVWGTDQFKHGCCILKRKAEILNPLKFLLLIKWPATADNLLSFTSYLLHLKSSGFCCSRLQKNFGVLRLFETTVSNNLRD